MQVKTTTVRAHGTWACKISRTAYAPQGPVKTYYDRSEMDYFAVVDGALQIYLIPVDAVAGLGVVYVRADERFRLPSLDSLADADVMPLAEPATTADIESG